jgi:hypothetical protein
MDSFSYENTEIISNKSGGKTIRKVYIKNGKGYKSITKLYKGKKLGTHKKSIHRKHLHLIKKGKFIPGLFTDCKTTTKKRRI